MSWTSPPKKVGASILGPPPVKPEDPDGGFNFLKGGDALRTGEVGARLLGPPPVKPEDPEGGFNFPSTKEGATRRITTSTTTTTITLASSITSSTRSRITSTTSSRVMSTGRITTGKESGHSTGVLHKGRRRTAREGAKSNTTRRNIVGCWRRSNKEKGGRWGSRRVQSLELFLLVGRRSTTTGLGGGTFPTRRQRERHRKAEGDDWFLVDDVGKQQRMIEVDEKIQQKRGDL